MHLFVLGDAAFLPLVRSKKRPQRYTLVDIDDFERITKSRWGLATGGYARATGLKYLARHHGLLHAYIMRSKPGEIVDHISGDRLDNRKQNLRIVTRSENAQNSKRPTFPGKTSRFKGVCWDRAAGRWRSRIQTSGVVTELGRFDEEAEAALSYDAAALELHGEFARTNAMMRLFEMETPFMENCSYGGWRRADGAAYIEPSRLHVLGPASYDERLTINMKNIIRETYLYRE